jgi:DNA-binding MarR family transcriptional regulator
MAHPNGDSGGFCGGKLDHELADRIGTAMARLNKMHAGVAAHMAKAGVDKASFILLANLIHLGPSRSSALAEAVFSDPSTVSRQVAALVKDGLVERRADPEDGRASVLAATEDGVRLFHERKRQRNAAISQLFESWTDGEWQQFAGLFERFVEDYERCMPIFIAESGLGPRSGGEK